MFSFCISNRGSMSKHFLDHASINAGPTQSITNCAGNCGRHVPSFFLPHLAFTDLVNRARPGIHAVCMVEYLCHVHASVIRSVHVPFGSKTKFITRDACGDRVIIPVCFVVVVVFFFFIVNGYFSSRPVKKKLNWHFHSLMI